MVGEDREAENDIAGGHVDPSAPRTTPPLFSMRRLWPGFVLIAGLAVFLALDGAKYFTLDSLRVHRDDLANYVAHYAVLTALCFMLVYAVMVAFSVPGGAVMTMTGGFLFGTAVAGGLVVVGATVGATAVFLIAKTALGDPLRARAGPALQKMEAGFQENALSYLLILRLVPLFPFFLVNLVPAFLGVSLRVYVSATFFGIIPGTVVFAQVGTGLDSILESGEELSVGTILSGDVLLALIGLAMLSALPLAYKYYQARQNADKNADKRGGKAG
ncbi:MAG: TVP38/TMEM64 family protein [Alphaproteobacteria bacterium]